MILKDIENILYVMKLKIPNGSKEFNDGVEAVRRIIVETPVAYPIKYDNETKEIQRS